MRKHLDRLLDRMRPLATEECPFDPRPPTTVARTAHWVRPELVAQVAYGEWTGKSLRELSKEDILGALGPASKPSASDRLLGTLGIFGVGLLVGAGAALLLAPKSGKALREDLGERFRTRGDGEPESPEPPEAATSGGEART